MTAVRSSHQRWSVEKGVYRNFAKFTGENLCQRLFFNKVASLRPATLLKSNLWHRCFPVNFTKFLRTPFLQNISERLLLTNNSCGVRFNFKSSTIFLFLSVIWAKGYNPTYTNNSWLLFHYKEVTEIKNCLSRSSHQRCSVKKGVLKNFGKFTEKQLCQSLFLNKVAGLGPGTGVFLWIFRNF